MKAPDSDILSNDSTQHAYHGNGDANQAGSSFIPVEPILLIDEQLSLLVKHDLTILDRNKAAVCLQSVNYYRLRGYWLTLEQNKKFLPHTTFEDIWNIYLHDQELRNWLQRVIEPLEVKLRTSFTYYLGKRHGALAHYDSVNFRNRKSYDHSIENLNREINRAKRSGIPCVIHNLGKYDCMPLWAVTELMSMGVLSRLYGNLADSKVSHDIAHSFGMTPFHLKSWLRCLTDIRNICAHHNRFYNRTMTSSPKLLVADAPYASDKQFPAFLVICRLYQRSWPEELENIISQLIEIISLYPTVNLRPMGFPDNWIDVLVHLDKRTHPRR